MKKWEEEKEEEEEEDDDDDETRVELQELLLLFASRQKMFNILQTEASEGFVVMEHEGCVQKDVPCVWRV